DAPPSSSVVVSLHGALPLSPLQTVADMAQGLVPGFVAPAIIDGLEMVKIENHQYQCMATAACQSDAVAQLTLEAAAVGDTGQTRSEEHTSELQSRENLVCRL